MPDLDFTALKKISYHGFKTEQDKDNLIDQGFNILQNEKTPFDAPQPPSSPQRPTAAPDVPIRAYKAAFRLAFDFLQQHTPAKASAEYWTQTTQDAAAITAQRPEDHLLQALLIATLEELERQAQINGF